MMNINDSFERIAQYLQNICNNKQLHDEEYETLKKLSNNKNSEIRSMVAETLASFPSDKSEALLVSLLNDDDMLVRANACDSLCFSKSFDTIELLKRRTEDSEPLVRCYAILSIADICNNIGKMKAAVVDFFKECLKNEPDDLCKVSLYSALLSLDNTEYLNDLLLCLENKDYHVRIFALRSLNEIKFLDNGMKSLVVKSLKKTVSSETVFHIKHSTEELIDKLSN